MKLLIEIPDNVYENCCKIPLNLVERAVKDGTPLPEYHGRLIDADKLMRNTILNPCHAPYIVKLDVNEAETIIPATEPPHWIERRLKMGLHDWTCSVCKCQCEETVKICPNCGVNTDGRYKMEEDDGGYWFKQTATKEDDSE